MTGLCCECKAPIGEQTVLVCAMCGGTFHFPDARIGEDGLVCGVHILGLRETLGRDVVPMCLRCDMAFRLEHGVPA